MEILISTAVFSFMVAGLYTMLHVGNISWQNQRAKFDAQGQLRTTLDMLSRDLRAGEGLLITVQTSSNVSFTFTTSGEGTVTYTWTNTGLDANRLIRTTTAPARTRIIARDISAISLTDNVTNVLVNLTIHVKPLSNQSGTSTDSNINIVKEIAKR